MKKVILSLLMMLALAVGTEAQEARQRVFQQIHDKAYIIANDSRRLCRSANWLYSVLTL